jgi:hypothetical protein
MRCGQNNVAFNVDIVRIGYEVTMVGEGVPYLIDRYGCQNAKGGPLEVRIRELPFNRMVVTFGEDPVR